MRVVGRMSGTSLDAIANLTIPPLAFDTGPGNTLLDRAARRLAGRPYEDAGDLAAAGTVVPELLDRFLQDPYYARLAPKSTGPEHFALGELDGHATEDVLATLMARLNRAIPTTTSDELGLPAQDKEAYAFALLGFLTVHGLPGTLARATGAIHASVLGSITPGFETGPAPRRLTIM